MNSDKNNVLIKKAAKGVKYVALQNWGHRAVNLLVFIVLARLLAPEAIGLVAMSMVYVALLQVFLEQGFVEAIVQSPREKNSFLDTAFWINIILSIFLASLSIIAAPYIGAIFQEPGLSPIICGLAPLLLIRGSVSVHIALLRRQMAFKQLATAAVTGVVIGGATSVFFAFSGFGVWALVIYQLSTRLIEAAILWLQNPWRPGVEIRRSEFRHLFAFGINVTGSSFVNFLNRYGADLVIGLFLGPVSVGYYNLSFRLSRTLVELLGGVVSMLSLPFFSRLQDDPETGGKAFLRITEQIAFFSFPLFIGMAVCAPQIVEVLFGEKWMPAVPVMRVLSIIGLLHSLYYINSGVFLGYGKPHWRLGLDALNAGTNMLVFLVAAQWSVIAVALGYVARGYITSPIPLLCIKKLIGINITTYLKNISVPLAVSTIMGISVFILSSLLENTISPVFLLSGQAITGGFIYIGIIYLIFPLILKRSRHYLTLSLTKNNGGT